MSRRSRRRIKRRMWQALAAVAVFGWAWQTHPAAVIATLLVSAVGLGVWAWFRRQGGTWRASDRAARDNRPTVLYRHYMRDGTPLYYGITNNYPARCGQHADSSWWWAYLDGNRSTVQQYPTRRAALDAETAAIRAHGPIGNTDENPWYAQQEPVRRQLKAAIGWTDPAPTVPAWPRRTLTGMRWAAR